MVLVTDTCVRTRFRFPMVVKVVLMVLEAVACMPRGVGSVGLSGPGEAVCGSTDLL